MTREPFPVDEEKLEAARRCLRRAISSMATLRADTLTSDPARAALKDAIAFTGDAIAGLKEIRSKLDNLVDAAARETLPLRDPHPLDMRTEPGGPHFIEAQTAPGTHDTPPLCGCDAHESCTHRRY